VCGLDVMLAWEHWMGPRLVVQHVMGISPWCELSVIRDILQAVEGNVALAERTLMEMFPSDEVVAFYGAEGLETIIDEYRSGTLDNDASDMEAGTLSAMREEVSVPFPPPPPVPPPDALPVHRDHSQDVVPNVIPPQSGEIQTFQPSASCLHLLDQIQHQSAVIIRAARRRTTSRSSRDSDDIRHFIEQRDATMEQLLTHLRTDRSFLSCNSIDLHGFLVPLAVRVVNLKINVARSLQQAMFEVVTGRGSHSHGQTPRLKPAIRRIADREGIRVVDSPCQGALLLILSNRPR